MGMGMSGPEGVVGRSIAGYHLDKLLGVGATGAVFLGSRLPEVPGVLEFTGTLPIELPDQAAIKLLILPWQMDTGERENFRTRFVREAQTLQRIRHPHILPVLTYGEDPATGLMFMILPYLSGGTLATRLTTTKGGLPFEVVANYLTQIAGALDYAHSQNMIHRDIKPANVLLNDEGKAYLADFSIVRLVADSHTQLTTTGRIMGTPAYMAPEQISGVGPLGPASDLYSLGMVVYEMVTGRVAFDSGSLMELIRQHLQDAPPYPRQLRPDLPPPAEAAILRALAKQPQDRFSSAGEFAQSFGAGLQGIWVGAPHAGQISPQIDQRAASGYAPTVADFAPAPRIAVPVTASSRNTSRQAPILPIALAGLALLLIAILFISNLSNIANIGATLFGSRGAAPVNSAAPTDTAETGSDGPGGPTSSFQIGHVYNYNAMIGHSQTTSLTNDNVTVTLNTLALSDSDNTAQIVVSFHDYDTQKGAHFLFVTLSNVYLFDDLGNRYQAESATPNEVLIDPGQGGTVLVKFPMVRSSAKYLQLYFNTDKNALITPCVMLQPSETTSPC